MEFGLKSELIIEVKLALDNSLLLFWVFEEVVGELTTKAEEEEEEEGREDVEFVVLEKRIFLLEFIMIGMLLLLLHTVETLDEKEGLCKLIDWEYDNLGCSEYCGTLNEVWVDKSDEEILAG